MAIAKRSMAATRAAQEVDAHEQADGPVGRVGQLAADENAEQHGHGAREDRQAGTGLPQLGDAGRHPDQAHRDEPDHEHDREGEGALEWRDEQVQPHRERDKGDEATQKLAA
jgi:hypothetical protein